MCLINIKSEWAAFCIKLYFKPIVLVMYLLYVMGVQSLNFHKYQMSSDFNFAFYLPKFDSGRLFLLFTHFKGFRIRDIYDQSAIWAGW